MAGASGGTPDLDAESVPYDGRYPRLAVAGVYVPHPVRDTAPRFLAPYAPPIQPRPPESGCVIRRAILYQ